jgi:cysteine desulfurase
MIKLQLTWSWIFGIMASQFLMSKKHYFFDHAATTPLDTEVLKAMIPYLKDKFGNPSNLYELGREANRAVVESTKTIVKILGCQTDEFVYTGSATEADNLAILGIAKARLESFRERNHKLKIITSAIEHKGILSACDKLEKEGFEIIKLPVQKNGLVDLDELRKELDERTILISITYADSETGTIQPISEISKIIRDSHASFPYFHTDASQAAGYLDINVNKLGVDLMTISAHKIGGPKGIGGLFVKKGIKIEPIIYGGGQQKELRSGTENVPSIVGFAQALSLCEKNKKTKAFRVKKLRDTLEKGIFKTIPKVVLNGHAQSRLPNFLNISILDIEGEALLLYLDKLGICVGTGSACNSQSLEPSSVLAAMGNPYEYIHGSIRFTLGKENKTEDIEYILKHLPKVVKKLRAISPLNLELNQKEKISEPKAFIGNQIPHFLKNKK